eukprot:3054129-Prorocentrum_lima.AAC.1
MPEVYVVRSNVVFPCLDKHGNRTLVRHNLNLRRHDVVLNAYVESVLRHGVIDEVRSCAWGPRRSDSEGGWELM